MKNKSSKKKEFNVGDIVTAYLRHSNGQKKKVIGEIKRISKYYGLKTYIITDGIVEDFSTRIVEK